MRNFDALVFYLSLSLLALAEGRDRVRLSDIQVLTLKSGELTTAYRSSPVPQINCVGGTAKGAFVPQVVQCYNRGWDGSNIQWECKTDMDNDYRFGEISVNCEGYDYPDDPYVLKGSCGLEYTLEFTKQGYENAQNKRYSRQEYGYGGGAANQRYPDQDHTHKRESGNVVMNIIVMVIIAAVIYTLYRTCVSSGRRPDTANDSRSGRSNDDFNGRPPPPGFHPDFQPPPSYEESTTYQRKNAQQGASSSSTNHPGDGVGGGYRPGFWTGFGGGGLLGYLLGSRNNAYGRGYNGGGYFGGPSTSQWERDTGFFATNSRPNFGGHSSAAPAFSAGGTRTASGFGGTKRR